MLLFVEGIDKAGKSTFLREFCCLTSLSIYRKIPPLLEVADHHNFFKGVGFALVELHDIFKFDVVVDRSFISDWVYTNRCGSKKEFSIWEEWEKRQRNINESLIIYVQISESVFLKRIFDESDPYMGANDYKLHQELYAQYLKRTSLPSVKIDGDVPFNEQINCLKNWVSKSASGNLRSKLLKYLPL